MRTGKVLCVVLLTVGACCAFPQYGPPKPVEEEQQQTAAQVPVAPIAPVEPVAPAVPGVPFGDKLTDQQKEELGEFWWQNQGVFTGEGPHGTQVVVQEQSSLPEGQVPDELASSPFIPSPSPDCAENQGCIPWQFCVDGVFTNTGEGILALRTPSKVPDTYTQKLCGQIGNLCCAIPDSILEAQQQGQSGGSGPYGPGNIAGGEIIDAVIPGSEILEVISTGDGAAPVAVVDVIDEGYDVPATGPGPVVPVVEQVSGGAGPVVEQVSGGVAGTYGGGVREDIGQQAVGSAGIVEVTDSGCTAYTHDCVPYFQCIDGEINTSGAGLIDVRIKPQKECTNPEYPDIPGICCKIPGATPLPVVPAPEPIQDCPGTAVCVLESQCNYDGNVNTDGAGIINTRLRTTCYVDYVDPSNYETGVCCQPPAPVAPAPLVTCPGTQVCVTQGQCAIQADATYDAASAVNSCYYGGDQAVIGECCAPPTVPEAPEPLAVCPGTQECVEQYQCTSDGTINTDGAGLINTRVYHNPCYLDDAYSQTGVCCQPPAPIAPEPLVTCPGNQLCVIEDQCISQGAATALSGSTYDICVVDGVNTGVCCDSPTVREVEVCPGDSVCIPEILCQGEILTHDDQYKAYGSTGDWSWSQCSISGEVNAPGVCCRNLDQVNSPAPYPVTSDAPLDAYVVADRCGERNYGLDLRTPTKLKKNEAVFGEFPWQAIIFFTNYTFKCGASLVEDKWLITAAHCVDGYNFNDFRIRLGEWQVDKYDEPFKYVDVEIASITIHPDFKPGPVHNDVALIELTAPVTFQYHINTVCLPNVGQKPSPGTRCFATGWGKDAFNGNYQPILKKVDVPYVDHAYCQDLLRKTRLGKYFQLDKSFMCAGGEENIDACEGDGGGPLVCKDPEAGTYYLAGITAWGIDCGQKDIPGVYADVQLFRPWLDGIIHGEQQQVSAGAYGRK